MSKGYEISFVKPTGGYKNWFMNSYNHILSDDYLSQPQYVIDEMYEQYYKVRLNKDTVIFKNEEDASLFMLKWG